MLRFGAKGIRLTSDNTLDGVTVLCPHDEVAILNDTTVAGWGVAFYGVVFGVAMALVQERWEGSRRLSLLLLLLTTWGVLFSLWLTYLELFVIHAICRWCVASAIIALVLWVLALSDWLRVRRSVTPA